MDEKIYSECIETVTAFTNQEHVLLATVGLPARGKSWLSAKIVTYINWLGGKAQVFNAGKFRRNLLEAQKSGRSEFFDAENAGKRDEIAKMCLDEAVKWLQKPGNIVAVFDATNTTPRRRKIIRETVKQSRARINLIFLESICTDEKVLEQNFLNKVRNSPDFKGLKEEDALIDLKKRISKYERVYRTVSDDEGGSYIKIQDLANKVTVKGIYGSIALGIVNLLMSCHNGTRPIVLLRAANSTSKDLEPLRESAFQQWNSLEDVLIVEGAQADQTTGSLGPYADSTTPPSVAKHMASANSPLRVPKVPSDSFPRAGIRMPIALSTSYATVTDEGKKFIKKLKDMTKNEEWAKDPAVFTSTLPRSIETAKAFLNPSNVQNQSQQWSALNVLDTGICHGMPVSEIKKKLPEEYRLWKRDPFRYRFPGGESYMDLCHRLSSVVLELERTRKPVVVVSHLSTLQALYSYFRAIPVDRAPSVDIKRHTVLILTPNQYGWKERRIGVKGIE